MTDEHDFGNPEVIEEEVDILIIGGGMAACGASFEIMRWVEEARRHGVDLKVKLVDKAALDRSGAVAQGLSAINTYMGENDPSDYVRYVRQDLMGIVREDLVHDVGRHVDDSVHNFEKWGLPIWKQPGDEGKPLAEGGNRHRLIAAFAHMKHIQFREETRYPGYYYRTDFLDLDEENWRCFVNSTYDRNTGRWSLKKVRWKQLVKD